MISPVPNSIDFSNQKKVELTHKSLYLLNLSSKKDTTIFNFEQETRLLVRNVLILWTKIVYYHKKVVYLQRQPKQKAL